MRINCKHLVCLDRHRMKITEILGRKYPGLEWKMHDEDYDTLIVYNGEKPKLEELEAYWPEVEAEVAADEAEQLKEAKFLDEYNSTVQMIALMKAIQGDKTELDKILEFWAGL